MKRDIEIDYYQITLGPAHLARIEALNGQPGIRCRGVALAASEETRRYGEGPGSDVETVLEGIYEATPLIRRLYATLAHADARSPDLIIIDAPADPIQFCLGRRAQSRGVRVFSRWAATILDHPRRRAKEFLKGFVYRGWDAYLVTGARGREYLSTFGVSDRDVFVCGNPVDAESIEQICDARSHETRQDASDSKIFRHSRVPICATEAKADDSDSGSPASGRKSAPCAPSWKASPMSSSWDISIFVNWCGSTGARLRWSFRPIQKIGDSSSTRRCTRSCPFW
jgi:hypothetical protein